MKKNQILRAAIAALTGAAAIGAGVFFSTNVIVGGKIFPKETTVFDLTEQKISSEEYEKIRVKYPDAQILWNVPFQGSQYPLDTAKITVSSLTEEEAKSLTYLTELEYVDAKECTDYAALLYLQSCMPECIIDYQVAGISGNASQASISDADIAELNQILPFLPKLETLKLDGKLPEREALLQLKKDFPTLNLDMTLDVGGKKISTAEEMIDLSGAELTADTISEILPLFAKNSQILLPDTGLTEEARKDLILQYPEYFFLCDLDFAGKTVSTASTQIDISGCAITVEETEEMLPFFPNLEKLIMSHCGIDNESMEALNQRYPDISIVWTLQIGPMIVRTDDTIFFPSKHGEHNLPSHEELQKLRYCHEMVAIDVGHSKATDCSWAANMPKLKYLIIADTRITDLTPLSGLKELIYLEAFGLDLTDYSPLLGCTAMQDLNIGTTFADPEPLTRMPWLHNLFWHGVLKNEELREKALMLEHQLPDTNIVLQTPRKNIGGMWRYIPNYYVFRELLDADFFNQEYTGMFLDKKDASRILACDHGAQAFAGDVLAEIVRYRIDNHLPITGIRNTDSAQAENLYQSLCQSRSWYDERQVGDIKK